ncbi:bifunctional diguanylate cyclase/phosphodiesterase [Pseudomonas saliphila]|uniref:bifunctional diguanylate cyclase/phosphodiesterase n=1 Tax=Pseudomonas saliphila TaxID=2586906 RepID=UPI00123B58C0|nr:EAL domain-containing protein [Pseudomonas saliphila]
MKPSLVRQLSLAITLFLLIAVGGSFMITLDNSRDQLRLQLGSHAQDAATALGLSLAPHIKDQAMVELMLSAIFDSGHFARISVASLDNGEILAERARDTAEGSAPAWFNRLADIQPEHGSAGIMDGWRQAARVDVISNPQPALTSFWHSALSILAWLCLCAVMCGVLCTVLLRRQLQPLHGIVLQAQAIGRRDYQINADVPRTTELQPVAAAMNQMAQRLKTLFAQESARTEEYRRQAYHDPLTGLPNRAAFGQALADAINGEAPAGHVIALRLQNLESINQQSGAEQADALLQLIAAPLQRWQTEHPAWLCSRSRGGEFMVLAPDTTQAELQPCVQELTEVVAELFPHIPANAEPIAIGTAAFQSGDTTQTVLSRIAQALTESRWVAGQLQPSHVMATASAPAAADEHAWQVRLNKAITHKTLHALFQPVFKAGTPTSVLHHKLLVRLPETDGSMLPAAGFLPWIRRLGLSESFDLCVLELAAKQLAAHAQPLAISITPETLGTSQSRQRFCNALAQYSLAKNLLSIEVDARYHADDAVLREFARDIAQAGGRLALQHFGHTPAVLGALQSANLQYLKIDSSFSRDLDLEPDKALYLEMLIRMVAHLQLPIIAEQVQSPGELEALQALGFDGVQGHVLAEPAAWPLPKTPVSG